jgi:hypothetical protein
VQEAAVSPLTAWENFYVIVGSSAGALTGLMFVVITLIARTQERRSSEAVASFSTPNVVHFCAVLLIAALLSAPWPALAPVSLLLGLAGLGGVTYVGIVVRRARRQTDYTPVLEDWLWHVIFPFVAYTVLLVAALLLPGNPTPALFGIGAVTVLLLFVGIHNAWETVTYLAIERFRPQDEQKE